MKSSYAYIRASGVRQLVKEGGKRCGHIFLASLDKYLHDKILRCLEVHNGGKKTLDGSLVNLTK